MKNIRICRYRKCNHESRNIDITKDSFINKGDAYYHSDCYESKIEEDAIQRKITNGRVLFRDLWVKNINDTVVYSQLFKMLNELLNRGIELEYLIFVLKYCISHKLNLNYPAGFPYFVDKKEIKDAYAKKKLLTAGYNDECFHIVENGDDSPKCSSKKAPYGFQNIIKGE